MEMASRWVEARHDQGFYLDQELIQDKGVESLRGSNLNPEIGNLGKFIEKAENGDIESGSYLLLERIDRFSRSEPLEIGGLISKLVKHYGINVVILNPVEKIISKDNISSLDVVMLISMELTMAHNSSTEKSIRIKSVWNRKRKDIESGLKIDQTLPAWLLFDEKTKEIKLDQLKAKTIKYIFDRTVAGIGQRVLCKELTDKFKPIVEPNAKTPIPKWNNSYISKLLSDRRLIGEYHPNILVFEQHKKHKNTEIKKRRPIGQPIKGYYPAVISEDTFYKAQVSKAKRIKEKSDNGSEVINLFRGLVFSKYSGQTFHLQTTRAKRKKSGVYIQKRLCDYDHLRGAKGACPWSLEYHRFERLMLDALSEIDPSAFAKKTTGTVKELRALRDEAVELEKQINKNTIQLKDQKYFSISETILNNLVVLKDRQNDIRDRISTLEKVEPIKQTDLVEGIRNLTRFINSEPEQTQERRKLVRDIIPHIVSRIEVLPLKAKNKEVKALILIGLVDGTSRHCLMRKLKKDHRRPKKVILVDKNKKPVYSLTDDGIVVFSHVHEGRSEDKNYGKIYVDGRSVANAEAYAKWRGVIRKQMDFLKKSLKYDKKWKKLDENLFVGYSLKERRGSGNNNQSGEK